MINLLPPDSKSTLIYARRNTQLIRYVIGLGIGAVGILLVVGAGLLYLNQQVNIYKDSIAQAETELKKQKESQVIAEVQGISDSLKLVVDVLGQEVLFSELIQQIGAIMPPGTILEDLSLSNELTGALSLQAGAVDNAAASQVQVNLRDPKNNIFSEADLESIKCAPADPDKPEPYPCKVTVRTLFAKGNNFMLLSSGDKDE